MKYLFSTAAIALAFAATTHAGSDFKSCPAPAPDYGVGFYIGAQGGFNAYQDTPSDETHRFSRTILGEKYTLKETFHANSNIGGFGGLKAGYVFNTGKIRPALELDGFYNGYSQDFSVNFRETYGNWSRHREFNGKLDVNSGAYLANALVRFDLGRFQPYVGAGFGGYTAEGTVSGLRDDSFSETKTSWAWQIIAGADYYVTPKFSVFAEYKFLNYMNLGIDREGQQLAGVGVRFHF